MFLVIIALLILASILLKNMTIMTADVANFQSHMCSGWDNTIQQMVAYNYKSVKIQLVAACH